MPTLPIGTGAYERLDNTPSQLINLVFEQDPTNLEDQVALLSRPGLSQLFDQGSTCRGVFRQDGVLGGLIFSVHGTTLYKTTQDGLTSTSVGTIAGSDRVVMAGNGSNILIATGTTLYSTDGSTVSTVSFPDGANVTAVAVLNNYFLAVRANSQRVYFSAIGGITFGALDYFGFETQPDDLVNIGVFGDELWGMGQSSNEIYVPSGDALEPFLRVNGRMFQMGCASRDTLVRLEDGLYWVGQDRIVYRSGSAPQRISTETIEQVLTENPTADLTAWAYTVEGHLTYVLNIGSVATYAYSMGKWTRFKGFQQDYLNVWSSTRLTNGTYVVGGPTTGTVWLLSPRSTYDGTQGFYCRFTAIQEVFGQPLRCDSLILDCSVGLGDVDQAYPTLIRMRRSNDRGRTWQPWRETYLGWHGQYGKQIAWSGAVTTGGLMRRPGAVFDFEVQAPSRFTIRRAKINESIR